jgi:RNA polymerase sigma-70 factor, ECF subfamily
LTKNDLNSGSLSADPAALKKWIAKVQRGDADAYQNIYQLFARRILNYVYRMVHSLAEAEDLTQETFVVVFEKLGTLKDSDKFEPWLFSIARNFVYQRHRKRSPANVSIDALDEDGHQVIQLADERKNPDEAFQSAELEDVVSDIISDLPEKYREVFILSALQHLSYERISDIIGRSLPSVKTDIHRARLEVRKRVKDYLKV